MTSNNYISDLTFHGYLQEIREKYPDLYELLDPERIEADAIEDYIKELNTLSWEFEDQDTGGRGLAWSQAQNSSNSRRVGMTSLLEWFSPVSGEMPGSPLRVLDVLGGSGTVAQLSATLGNNSPTVFTADISNLMISSCRAHGLPYIRQSATRSLFRDDSLDGVLIGYGTQLLSPHARQLAVLEAYRTLKPGSRLVLHAFEAGQGAARFFDDVVHPYSRTGHPHEHLTRAEIRELFADADFCDMKICDIHDPLILDGQTAEEARRNALMHLYSGYDLCKISGSQQDVEVRLEALVEETLGPISVRREQEHYIAEVPRTAVVAIGVKM
ncbi:methyltransferase domain-containing protein [Amycolatopsis sp. NPDC051071]|uniref:methyltransferase domain-containing protein n=1 Tax=Amycolatopsis sp. NPDC051071 TaxID=3154637 RepID=UPI00341964F6